MPPFDGAPRESPGRHEPIVLTTNSVVICSDPAENETKLVIQQHATQHRPTFDGAQRDSLGRDETAERVIACRQPRGVVHRCHIARHERLVRLVTEGHDVFMLVVLPLEEALHHLCTTTQGSRCRRWVPA